MDEPKIEDGIGEYYAGKARRAEQLREQIAAVEAAYKTLPALRRQLEMEEFVGD